MGHDKFSVQMQEYVLCVCVNMSPCVFPLFNKLETPDILLKVEEDISDHRPAGESYILQKSRLPTRFYLR